MSLGTAVKREGLAQAWSLLITSITGEAPYMERTSNGIDITWKPGQAKIMEQYLSTPSDPNDPDALNVSVALSPVLLPLVIKKYGMYLLAYTVGVWALTKYMG